MGLVVRLSLIDIVGLCVWLNDRLMGFSTVCLTKRLIEWLFV